MLLSQIGPQTTSEVLVLPLLLCLFGAFSWWMGLRALDRGGKGWGRLPGGLLLGFAIFHGLQLMWSLYEPSLSAFYRATLSQRMFIAHFVALFLPLLVIAIFYVVAVIRRRRDLDQE